MVDPIGKRTTKARVVPGRLNLFNPKGQRSLQIPVGQAAALISSPASGGVGVDDTVTPGIFRDEYGEYFKIKNDKLAQRNTNVEKEFERLMAERASIRTVDIGIGKQHLIDTSLDDFYTNDGLGSQNKHKSPTRRLI